jgi:apolipoprotein N-acyltransferase
VPLAWAGGEQSTDSEPSRPQPRRFSLWPLLPATIAIAATLAYSHFRQLDLAIQAKASSSRRPPPRIALIQSDMLADWKNNPQRDDNVMREQMELSLAAVRGADPPVDLVIWPETMYRDPLWTLDPHHAPPPEIIDHEVLGATPRDLADKTKQLGAALLVGIDRYNLLAADEGGGLSDAHGNTVPYGVEPFNSSVCVDRAGQVVGTYDKMHLLPFGEYIPLVAWMPFLRNYSPITGTALPGRAPAGFELDGVVYSPNICYETVLPQLIRHQVVELARGSQTPDVLVNVTNDAWYWGSSELDMHLASGVFRAVEMRTPVVIAANRGLSAHVDYTGRVVAVTERDRPAHLVTDVRLLPRRGLYPSLYARWGDWFSLIRAGCCGALTVIGSMQKRKTRRREGRK